MFTGLWNLNKTSREKSLRKSKLRLSYIVHSGSKIYVFVDYFHCYLYWNYVFGFHGSKTSPLELILGFIYGDLTAMQILIYFHCYRMLVFVEIVFYSCRSNEECTAYRFNAAEEMNCGLIEENSTYATFLPSPESNLYKRGGY